MKKYISRIEPSSEGYNFSLRIEDEVFDVYPLSTMLEFTRAGAEFESVEKMWTGLDDSDRDYFLVYGNLETNNYRETLLELKQKGWEF